MEDIIKNINTTDFINAVKNELSIWNTQSAEYSDKTAKRKAWERIMTKFIKDFPGKSNSEKLNIAMMFQRKWKSLRNSYTRELLRKKQETRSGSTASSRKQYLYFNNLNFLQTLDKPTTSSIEDDEEPEEIHDALEEETEIEKSKVRPLKRFKSAKKNSNQEDVLLSIINKLTKTINKPDSPDKLFMLSLVPELEQLPEEIKFDVKAEILNVFRRAKQQNTITCASRQIYSSESYIPTHTLSQPESTITSRSLQEFPSLSITVSTQTPTDSLKTEFS